MISAALDCAGTYAAYSLIDPDASILTIEFKVNLMSPGRGERFLFRGEVTKPGSPIIVSDGRAYSISPDGPAKLIASMTATIDGDPRTRWDRGMTIETKTIGTTRVLYVMAADAEYGTHLRARIAPPDDGRRPVEAAVVLTRALAQLEAAGRLPHLVVSLGSAGSAALEQTGVYQASSLSYRDMDASAFGFEKGVTPFLDLPATVPLSIRIPDVPAERGFHGANVISGPPMPASMPTWWTWRALPCCAPARPSAFALIGLRGISDGAAEVKHVSDTGPNILTSSTRSWPRGRRSHRGRACRLHASRFCRLRAAPWIVWMQFNRCVPRVPLIKATPTRSATGLVPSVDAAAPPV